MTTSDLSPGVVGVTLLSMDYGDAAPTSVRVLEALGEDPSHALFVTELVARLGAPPDDIEAALAAVDGDGVVVVDHPSPDPHLAGDLRVVALACSPGADPVACAERVWSRWVRDALAGHRCC